MLKCKAAACFGLSPGKPAKQARQCWWKSTKRQVQRRLPSPVVDLNGDKSNHHFPLQVAEGPTNHVAEVIELPHTSLEQLLQGCSGVELVKAGFHLHQTLFKNAGSCSVEQLLWTCYDCKLASFCPGLQRYLWQPPTLELLDRRRQLGCCTITVSNTLRQRDGQQLPRQL